MRHPRKSHHSYELWCTVVGQQGDVGALRCSILPTAQGPRVICHTVPFFTGRAVGFGRVVLSGVVQKALNGTLRFQDATFLFNSVRANPRPYMTKLSIELFSWIEGWETVQKMSESLGTPTPRKS